VPQSTGVAGMCCCPTSRDVLCALFGFAFALFLVAPWALPGASANEPAVQWTDMAYAGGSVAADLVADLAKAALRAGAARGQ
jgi:hypothetical protein